VGLPRVVFDSPLLGRPFFTAYGASKSWVYATHGRNFLLTILRLATEREELKIVADQVGAPTCALDLAEATARILVGIVSSSLSQFAFPEASGTYHMTAAGQTKWYEFANAILEQARHASQNLPWLASATRGSPLITSRVLPITTGEFLLPARRPANSVLSNARLRQTFGVVLPDWRAQLHSCFSRRASTAAIRDAVDDNRRKV